MIKTCYRGMIKDDEPGYFFLFLLIWFSFSAFVGFGTFWGFLLLFTNLWRYFVLFRLDVRCWNLVCNACSLVAIRFPATAGCI